MIPQVGADDDHFLCGRRALTLSGKKVLIQEQRP